MTGPDDSGLTPDTALQIVRDSPLFDAGWYLRRYGDVAASGLEPALHYLKIGAAIGRDPGPGFTTDTYAEAYLDDADDGLNPLVHFETIGRNQGLCPDPGHPSVLAHRTIMRPAVDVVVPVYNALQHVQACLTSLAETPTGCAVRVIVVDDASEAETADWLRVTCPKLSTDQVRFECVHQPENRGYTAAANTGLRMSRAPHVVLLNSDTVVTPYWLDGLLRCVESDPAIGIAGPLSNAASWQNVPELHAKGGGFAINALPNGMTPADMAALVRHASQVRHPRSPVVNGFCYMIRRAVLEKVGYLDEETFPVAYGEETDLCLRAAAAGFELAYADDTYVYHAKSQSFGTARRKALSEAGLQALRAKHGADHVSAAITGAAICRDMAAMRTRVAHALADRARIPATGAMQWLLQQKILFLLPVGAGGGGAHSVVQEAMAMRALGVTVQIATSEYAWEDFRKTYADIPGFETLFVPYEPEAAALVAAGFDVVIATLYSSVAAVEEIVAAYPKILPAYYAQDYEPLFFAIGTPEWKEAHGSYTRLPQMQIFAKTDWIRHQIEAEHGVSVAKVSPSLDHDVYFPDPDHESDPGQLRVAAMIRPETPRRGAARTMELMSHLHRLLGSRVHIELFGCDPEDPEFLSLTLDFPFEMRGKLVRTDVARLLRRTDVFVDMSDYQAFGRTALEAMACGALALVPMEGGADEYAVDGINALVADTMDVAACVNRLAEIETDPALLQRMRLAALDTAALYSPRRAAMSELKVLAVALARHRAPPAPPVPAPVQEEILEAEVSETVILPVPAFAGGNDPMASMALTLPSGPHAETPDPAPDIGVHLHLHYPELLPEIVTHLQYIPVPFSLYVSTHEAQIRSARRTLTKGLSKAKVDVRTFPNRGRDIGPFVSGFDTELAGHDLICHIHSKRSPQNSAKHDWRQQLLGSILGSPAGVAEILRLFAQNPHLGLVYPEFHTSLWDQINWGTNLDLCRDLAERLGTKVDPGHLTLFPAGCMFWIRSAAMAPLFEARLTFDDFPEEARQYDGTLAHAIERLLGQITAEAGFSQLQVRARTGETDAAS